MRNIMSSNQKQKQEKTDTTFWDERRKDGWIIGEAIYNQDDLIGEKSYFQVLVLNATGRMPEGRLADWIEAAFSCLSWPARIWCNQIGSLAGTMRASPVAALTAGMLASDCSMYGPGTQAECADFITDALDKKQNRMSPEDILAAYPTPFAIPGYARPVDGGDERLVALERVTARLGFETGEHLALAYEIREVLAQKYNKGMNIAGYSAAFLSDQGFSPTEQYRIASICVNSDIHACYAEAADNPPGSFSPMRCDDVDYQGKPPRPVPDY